MNKSVKVKVKPRRFIKVLVFVIIFFALLFVYAKYINTHGLKVHEIAIYDEELNQAYQGLKIVHFSDLHYGMTTFIDDIKKLVQEINLINPDIIVFTGDLFESKNVSDEDVSLLTKYLDQLEARLFKFAVIGDHDEAYLDVYQTILEDSNFILLDNEVKLVYDQCSEPIQFVGLSHSKDIDDLYNPNYYTITIMHKPDLIKNIPNSNLVLAGHSLGGQIKIPFLGGIIKRDGANTYINEYYEVEGKKLYISNGIGTQNFGFRLFNQPSINFFRL